MEPSSSMPTLDVRATARPSSPQIRHLPSGARYTLTCVSGFLGALLLIGAFWFLLRCYRRRRRKGKPKDDLWIPFRSTASLSERPSVRRVQPLAGSTSSVWTDVKAKMADAPGPQAALLSAARPPVPRGRRQSVPVLPSVFAAHAVSAMDFTKRRFSTAGAQEGPASDSEAASGPEVGSGRSRRASVSSTSSLRTSSRRRSSTVSSPGEVDRYMYGCGPEASLNAHGLGKLCFTLSYTKEIGMLYVKVHRAVYLSVAKRAKEYGDFHVEVTLTPNDSHDESKTYKTSVVRSVRNPIFEQEFSFHAYPEDLKRHTLLFNVKERRHIEVGWVTFPLHDLEMTKDENSNLHCIWRDIVRPNNHYETCGEVYLSLSYNPLTAKLYVGVVKCRNLCINSQETAVFCRLTIMSAEKVLKDERSRVLKKDLASPLVDQTFVFGLDKAHLNNVCLSVTVWGKRSLGFNNLIGKCILGPVTYSDGEGLLHWSTMMHEPQKTVHQWHTLK